MYLHIYIYIYIHNKNNTTYYDYPVKSILPEWTPTDIVLA